MTSFLTGTLLVVALAVFALMALYWAVGSSRAAGLTALASLGVACIAWGLLP